mgnify:CR=1 FL=1
MISVGIDVSKGKSTVCILKPYGEIISSPYDVMHTAGEMDLFVQFLKRLEGEIRIIMEATGVYHLPVLSVLKENGFFVAVINPYEMKKYASRGIRRVKTDKHDSVTIANYGLDNWYRIKDYSISDECYAELRMLGRRYYGYMEQRIKAMHELMHLLDYTMPGIRDQFLSWRESNGKDKLADFCEKYWHYDNITCMSESEFIDDYYKWTKEKGYRKDNAKAIEVYRLASEGIPTLSSSTPSTKMLVLESVKVLRAINNTLGVIVARMRELAKSLPEYEVVRAMPGVGDVLALKLMAEIGDIRRFHNSSALIAYAGIDAPPYQSGQFNGTNRKISKRGSRVLRKVGYEVMKSIKCNPGKEDLAVYEFIVKKEAEGKSKCQAKIAGLNKFLRIYYARVSEVYK